MEAAAERDRYLSRFDSFERSKLAAGPGWLRGLRKSAIESFATLGFPTPRQEDWRYTNVAPLLESGFEPIWSHAEDGMSAARVRSVSVGAGHAAVLVFVNGVHVESLSSRARALPAGVRVASLAAALASDDAGLVERHLGRRAGADRDGFTALATAFVRDGAFVWIPDGVAIAEPIELVFLSTSPEGLSQPRNIIVAGRESRAIVIESYAGADTLHLTNAVTEVSVGAAAKLEHLRILRPTGVGSHVANVGVAVERDALYVSHSVATGTKFARTALNVTLEAPGAECELNGLYLTNGEQFVDNHTAIDHAAPHGTSRELYKGILGGRSRAVFNGKVMVRKGALKTDARQTNKNLLLSARAEVDTKPELQIHADDVKCSHGAAIGALDPDALFYLKSRGIGEEASRRLLTYGFASDVVARTSVEAVRSRIEALVREELEKGFGS